MTGYRGVIDRRKTNLALLPVTNDPLTSGPCIQYRSVVLYACPVELVIQQEIYFRKVVTINNKRSSKELTELL